jgi:amino acid adenylation domain-containing protein
MLATDGDKLKVFGAVEGLNEATLAELKENKASLLAALDGACLGAFENGTIAHIFAGVAERFPDRIAVEDDKASLDYRALYLQSLAVARGLRTRGIAGGDAVAICMERSCDLIVAIMGVLMAGGCYLPLDPSQPTRRLRDIVADAGPKAAIVDTEGGERFAGAAFSIFRLTELRDHPPQEDANPWIGLNREQAAYIIYTSGSTGVPKGVPVSHRNVVRLFASSYGLFAFDEHDVWTLFHSYGFDFSVWEIFGALLFGGKVVVVAHDVCRDYQALRRLLAERKVTVFNQTPASFAAFVEQDKTFEQPLTDLRFVIFGGEKLNHVPLREWIGRYGFERPELINMYGITECTVHVTFSRIDRRLLDMASASVGKPLPDLQVLICDESGNSCPDGMVGEIHVAGAGVASGYLNRPDLSAERFVHKTWQDTDLYPCYRTGDFGRILPDGSLEYLGRRDSQVKIRGYRIELEEIDKTLRQHPAVNDAVVVARRADDGDDSLQLCAYVVADSAWQAERENDDASAQADDWVRVFDDMYQEKAHRIRDDFDISGWIDSYSGEHYPAAVMQQWRDNTLNRIKVLAPKRILEIGSGTGLLLHGLIDDCESYTALDVSAQAVASLRASLNPAAAVKAHFIVGDVNRIRDLDRRFDLVIINSVAQYFPSAAYLEQVLDVAVQKLADEGNLFVGDVRGLEWLEAFHASVLLHQISDTLSCRELKQALKRRIADEKELLLSPAFFASLSDRYPFLQGLVINLKQDDNDSEMSRYRYDVVLTRSPKENASDAAPVVALRWEEDVAGLDGLRAQLAAHQGHLLGITAIPNRRILADCLLLEELRNGDLDKAKVPALKRRIAARLDASPRLAVAAGDLFAVLAEFPHLRGELCYPPEDASVMTLLVRPAACRVSAAASPWRGLDTAYANDPTTLRKHRALVNDCHRFLDERLPDYMCPRHILLMESLPLNANGKVDKDALPAPGYESLTRHRYMPPQTEVQAALVEIWSEILGVSRIGMLDNFFELGGHSLLATQVVARANTHFQVALSVKELFRAPTIAYFSELIEAVLARAATTDAADVEMEEVRL